MEYIKEMQSKSTVEVSELYQHAGKVVRIKGTIHKIREMSEFAFVILRTRRELLQCVYSAERAQCNLNIAAEGCACIIEGEVVADRRVMNGAEIHIINIEVLSTPADSLPVVINKKKLDISLDTNLTYRPVSLRNPSERAIFKIQEGIVRGFREYLLKQGFTEIRTPKIVFAGAEGGANIFKLDYFGKQVYLAQSPQFYKQTMVGVFERVFEVAPVYRAEKHDTSRHLNEYISLDFEMGFINDFTEIMQMETGMLKYMFQLLDAEYGNELELLNVKVPRLESVPAMKFMDAKKIIADEYRREITDYHDFEPEEEQLLCEYAKKKFNSEFIFVTHYPSSKRPFYAMDDKNDPNYTLSFDLLYNGLEVTTGGQRIHDYKQQVEKMVKRGMNPDEFQSYLMVHKCGIPPHGGLGAGLERLTMKFLGLGNIRNACLFPRDMNRVTP
ncbi:MAG: aspartate--tRNA(Asn) ligase [Eubacterium sp.]|nr:aspartate--tRNA(Asn) ligase [Eubacterium sp.]